MIALLIIACCFVGDGQAVVQCDIFEWNTVLDEKGKPIFEQAILWRFECHDYKWDYYVAAWCLEKDSVTAVPHNGEFVGRIKGKRVVAKMYRKTRYVGDVEMENRKVLAEEKRSGLK